MTDLFLDGRPFTPETTLVEGQTIELSALAPQGATLALTVAGAPLEPFLRPGDPAWRWRWLVPAAAGAYPVRLCAGWPDGRTDEQHVQLQVAPRKLDAEHYAALLDDLQRLGRALVFALTGGATSAAPSPAPDTSTPTPTEELHTLFGDDLTRLAAAIERLARRPPDRLRTAPALVEPGQLRDTASIDWGQPGVVAPHGDAAAFLAGLPALPARRPEPTYDAYEPRLLRRLLSALGRRADLLATRAALTPAQAEHLADACARLRTLQSLPFLNGVPPLADYRGPTPRLQRDPDYRVVYRHWQLLRRRPLLTWDAATLQIPVSDLPRLYERWCAACVALALLELPGHTLVAQALLNADNEVQLLALPEDRPLVVVADPTGTHLRLFYHPRYPPFRDGSSQPGRRSGARGARREAQGAAEPVVREEAGHVVSLDRHTRVPDLALHIERPGAPPAVIVLDAKYRLDASGGVPEAALADAYSYLGAIGTPDGERATLAAALLFPGRGNAEHYASGVAALPLLPGTDGALREWIERVMSENEASYAAERGSHYSQPEARGVGREA